MIHTNPTNVSSITDGTSYPTLDGPRSITITTIENSIYALVAASNSNGIQTINITDPYNPTNVSYVVQSERYPTLDDAFSITTTTIEGSTYALVASDGHPGGVQIIKIDIRYHTIPSTYTHQTGDTDAHNILNIKRHLHVLVTITTILEDSTCTSRIKSYGVQGH